MKKFICVILALVFMACAAAENELKLPAALEVVSNTKVTGAFFTDLWSINTSDMDVRSMLHGLRTVLWKDDSTYSLNPDCVLEKHENVNADGSKTYFITLKPGLKYSDGTPITAADFVYSILLQASPYMKELGAIYSAYSYIKGYDAYFSGEAAALEGLRLYSDTVFAITVDAAYLPFFYEDSYLDVTPYPAHIITPGYSVRDTSSGCVFTGSETVKETVDAQGNTLTIVTELGADMLKETLFGEHGYASYPAVCSGPYMLKSYEPESGRVEFTVNPNFPGRKPVLGSVALSYANAEDAVNGVKNGTYTLYNKNVSGSSIRDAMSSGAAYSVYPRRGMGAIYFACEKPGVSNVHVRRAINMALDKESFVNEYLGGFGMSVNGYYGAGQWMVQAAIGAVTAENMTAEKRALWDAVDLDKLKTCEYDLSAAAYELKLAGEDAPSVLTMAYVTESGANMLLFDYLEANLMELGIKLEKRVFTFSEMLEDVSAADRQCDMYFLGSNFERVFDPSNDFTAEGSGITRYADAELAQCALNMRYTDSDDIAGYYAAWFEFQQKITETLPVIGVYSNIYVDVYSQKLANYDISAGEGWPYAVNEAYFARPGEEQETQDGFVGEQQQQQQQQQMMLVG